MSGDSGPGPVLSSPSESGAQPGTTAGGWSGAQARSEHRIPTTKLWKRSITYGRQNSRLTEGYSAYPTRTGDANQTDHRRFRFESSKNTPTISKTTIAKPIYV